MSMKRAVIACVDIYRRMPGKVLPAGYGSAMPAYLYEPGDYGPAVREERINPDTNRKYETTVQADVRLLPTARELSDAEAITRLVNRLPEPERKLIWLYGSIKTSRKRTFTFEARKMGIKRQELSRRIDRAFQKLDELTENDPGSFRKRNVADIPQIGDESPTMGHDTFWRGFDSLEPETRNPIDFSRFLKRA